MKKRILWIITSLVGLLLIALIGIGNYFYNVAINSNNEAVDLHDSNAETASATIEEEHEKLEEILQWTEEQVFEDVEIQSKDGLNLKAVFLENENPNGKAVILAHGYKGNNTQMPGVTRFYYEQGFDILKPDARGHGKSEGDYIGYGWHDREDYKQWIQFLLNDKKEDRILLHGFSMGAATVLMTSGEELPSEVKGIIADSGYTSVHDELSHQLKYLYHLPAFPIMQVTSVVTQVRAGYSLTEASAMEQVKKNKLPIMIIHGDLDELVPTDMAYQLYEVAGGDKELWIVPEAKHTEGYTVEEKEYQTRLMDFFNKTVN